MEALDLSLSPGMQGMLRTELVDMKMRALQRRAVELGVSEDALDDAEEKSAVIELIMSLPIMRELEGFLAAGEHRAAAALLVKLLRRKPGDAMFLERLLAEAERRRDEATAAADVLARAAEAELLAMEAGEQAAGSSKLGKKKGKKKRQQERARAAKAAAVAEAAARAPEPEPEPELELDLEPEPELEPEPQPQLQPPLIDAAERGNLAELEALLAAGADIEVVDEGNGSTAFLWACAERRLECAQALAAAGCDVAAASSHGNTALMFAANRGHAAVVAWLLGEVEAAGTLEARNDSGDTAFLIACAEGRLGCALALATAGCDVAAASRKGTTARAAAAQWGPAGSVAWLLGADAAAGTLEARDNTGGTAFLVACAAGQLECAQKLAAAKCDLAATNSKGATALILAAYNSNGGVLVLSEKDTKLAQKLGQL
jgi:ankyrin repeat protein